MITRKQKYKANETKFKASDPTKKIKSEKKVAAQTHSALKTHRVRKNILKNHTPHTSITIHGIEKKKKKRGLNP